MCSFKPYLQAGYPLLWIETHEEQRSIATIAKELLDFKDPYNVYTWDIANGLKLHKFEKGILRSATIEEEGMEDPLGILQWIEMKSPENSVIILKDYHAFIGPDAGNTRNVIIRKLRNLLPYSKGSHRIIAIMSSKVMIPFELDKEITVIPFTLPDLEALRKVLHNVSVDNGAPYPAEDEDILKAALGMTTLEAENAFALSLVEKKCFDLAVIQREKAAVIKKTGLLEVVNAGVSLDDVGGLELLKKWLIERAKCFNESAKTFGIKPPKGLLLVGPPGTGKSLCAKAVAAAYKRPLLRLDLGKIYGSLVGESESNVRQTLAIAEAVAPDILWIDELEKAFGGMKGSTDGDSGTGKRVFSTFLTWLQEKTSDVFVVATANNVQQLPSELLRSGRFDVIVWVDFPDVSQRQDIFGIQIRKTGRDKLKYDTKKLSENTEGYSGAEIENIVKEALVQAFTNDRELTTQDLMDKIPEVTPISKMMKSDIDASRKWAEINNVRYASEKSKPKFKAETVRKVSGISSTGVGG